VKTHIASNQKRTTLISFVGSFDSLVDSISVASDFSVASSISFISVVSDNSSEFGQNVWYTVVIIYNCNSRKNEDCKTQSDALL